MAKKQQGSGGRPRDSQDGQGGGYGGGGNHGDSDEHPPREPYDDPDEHLEIERRRFLGSLPPTPERYALAREQWYRLPGALVRPSMDPPAGTPASGDEPPKTGGEP
ncbi:hypothetical protein [Ideonella sp. BN130291]|uniref:hypothetical protein n=1 Tax=Ideonella sp. BN130291 TaxID=3112940 RepID=UPI002E25AD0F|nr:hypothetical protein [Ideonella sp. BN130291]